MSQLKRSLAALADTLLLAAARSSTSTSGASASAREPMKDQEGFWSIAAQLRADRRWARRIMWTGVTCRLAFLTLRAVALVAPAGIILLL
jgi:hypothetical protein